MSVIVLITLGSLGTAMSCKSNTGEGHFHYRYYNYAVGLAGVALILKEYM